MLAPYLRRDVFLNQARQIKTASKTVQTVDNSGDYIVGDLSVAAMQIKFFEWALACFDSSIVLDTDERFMRFGEEAMELLQTRLPKDKVIELADYVYSRPVGKTAQEIAGVLSTLSTLSAVLNINIEKAVKDELHHAYAKIEQIREKQKHKPSGLRHGDYDKPNKEQ